MTNSLSFFFVKHVLVAGELYAVYLTPYFVCQMAAIPLWFRLSRRIGKHKATMWAVGWYAFWSSFIPIIAVTPMHWYGAFEIPQYLGWLPSGAHDAVMGLSGGHRNRQVLFLHHHHVPQGLRHRRPVGLAAGDGCGRARHRHRANRATPGWRLHGHLVDGP